LVLLKKVDNSDPGTTDIVGGNDWDKLADYYNNIDVSESPTINNDTSYRQDKLQIRNSANTFGHKYRSLASAARTITIPDTDLTIPTNLDSLSDTTITSPAIGALLYYNGSAWIVKQKGTAGQYFKTNATGSDAGWETDPSVSVTLDNLQDVVNSSPSRGDVLEYDGTDWRNVPQPWFNYKSGTWFATADTTAYGLLGTALTLTGAPTTALTRDATYGIAREFTDSGTTTYGLIQTTAFYRFQWNSKVRILSTTSATTNARWWFGFASTASALSTANPLNVLSGVMIGVTADTDTNYQVIHNDGTGASVLDSTMVTRLGTTDPPTEFEIQLNTNGTASIRVNGNLTNTISTELPTTSTDLFLHITGQRIGGSNKKFAAYKVFVSSL